MSNLPVLYRDELLRESRYRIWVAHCLLSRFSGQIAAAMAPVLRAVEAFGKEMRQMEAERQWKRGWIAAPRPQKHERAEAPSERPGPMPAIRC